MGVQTEHVQMLNLQKQVAMFWKKNHWILPNVPDFLMKVILGDATMMVLKGSAVI